MTIVLQGIMQKNNKPVFMANGYVWHIFNGAFGTYWNMNLIVTIVNTSNGIWMSLLPVLLLSALVWLVDHATLYK